MKIGNNNYFQLPFAANKLVIKLIRCVLVPIAANRHMYMHINRECTSKL
jgi:hypothetical protein